MENNIIIDNINDNIDDHINNTIIDKFANNDAFCTNFNININQNKSKNANNESSNNLSSIVDRKFIMDYLNKPGSDVWKLKGLEKLEFVVAMFEDLLKFLDKVKIIEDDYKFSPRQQFIIDSFNEDLEEGINNELNNNVRYQNYIIDSYWFVWDFFENYGNYDTQCIHRNEYNVITKIVKNFYNIALKVLNEHKK